jgi:hypothetical protein
MDGSGPATVVFVAVQWRSRQFPAEVFGLTFAGFGKSGRGTFDCTERLI